MLPGDPDAGDPRRGDAGARQVRWATTSSPATARRCSAPTTRRASRRSWRPCSASLENPALLHGAIAIAFTPDEEVGRGADRFDVPGFGARIAYTLDGEELGRIENETFNAHAATFRLKGYNVHPGTAKDKMVNTLYAAAEIIRRLPEDMRPETTEKRQGYLHPRAIEGSVDELHAAPAHPRLRDGGSQAKIAHARAHPRRGGRRLPQESRSRSR